jgi:hypothetical protein
MPQTRRAKRAGNTALDRLQTSIEGAESALKDLRREVGRDSRDRLNDLATTLKSARRNVTRSRQRIVKEMETIEQRLTKGKKRAASKGKKRPAPKRGATAARASTARSRKAATAKTTAKRRTKTATRSKTARSKATRSKATRSKAAAKPRATRTAKSAAKKARAA